MTSVAFHNGRFALGEQILSGQTLLVSGGKIEALGPDLAIPAHYARYDLSGDILSPGFVDIQVNGGGGALFNDAPTVKTIATIAKAHAKFGTTSLLPTLISDDLDKVAQAIAAVDAAIEAGVPGILGIHLEGPFLNARRKGVHDASKFKVLDQNAIELLTSLTRGKTLITLAPETAPPGAIAELVRRGAVVFAGHTEASYEQIIAAEAEGLRGFTHIFNAMSQLASRAPGVVGAALASPTAFSGLIADGVHVHPANMALVARLLGPQRTVLVSDAMPTLGSDQDWFELKGEKIFARGLTCYTPDGVLAGSNLSMHDALGVMMQQAGIQLAEALQMASHAPALAMGIEVQVGQLVIGAQADFVQLDADANLVKVWQNGRQL
ncbi:MAG: N-acetylglucosamine-6-phosphate deacetylase [Aquidulcibacter sp.]|jgi:N-acetylglucosamine-6-phosphate deacetylase|uniref:N-acetylglucosamine-6-phosphate deacetylase n=1 Tax=Aquidulcibacter sp. TaxID=2052990 RepID=UPI0022CC7762|nr:N-acetylglucosamine-6-phosphate deacetylase [Aquidulcibacter sp.]MCE2891102.1 N-acetylglucosamine-6-phosphate deacetylase [Hyphomonadaceae bacterium]MCZ8207642.1 N-acetylglucosamine-6-phosphate deacetylase [Aquidulcibacter sp.]